MLSRHSVELMASLDLLAAAFSAVTGTSVGFASHGDSALRLHEATAVGGPVGMRHE